VLKGGEVIPAIQSCIPFGCTPEILNELALAVKGCVKKNCDYQLNYFHKSILFNIMLHFKYDVITLKLLIKCQINIKIS